MLEWIRSRGDTPAGAAGSGEPPMQPPTPAKPSPLGLLAPRMPELLALAARGASPVTWGAAISIAPEAAPALDMLAALTSRLGRAGVLNELCETFPAADPYRDWFGQLLTELIEEQEPEP